MKFLKYIFIINLFLLSFSITLKSEIVQDIDGAYYNGGIGPRDGTLSTVTDADKDVYLGSNIIFIDRLENFSLVSDIVFLK